MKEQTLTAFEFYENSDTANVYDVMEQYAQAKVEQEREKWKEEKEELETNNQALIGTIELLLNALNDK